MKFYSRPNELLQKHQDLVSKKFEKLDNKNVLNIIDKLIKDTSISDYKDIIYSMVLDSIKFHDVGKMNPYFQKFIGNDDFKNYVVKSMNDKEHSYISCIYYCSEIMNKYILNIKAKRRYLKTIQSYLSYIMLGLAYNISKHHGGLGDLKPPFIFIHEMLEYYKNNKIKFEYIDINIENIEYLQELNLDNIKLNGYVFYVFNKLVYSLLIKSDFLSVYEIENKEFIERRVDKDLKSKLKYSFMNNEIVKAIHSGEYSNECNKYRSEMFLESEKNLLKNLDKNIFFLEAPTGSGKSITSLNLMLNLLSEKNDKVYYISPLNNISEQTYTVAKNMLSRDIKDIVLSNSKENIVIDEEDLNYNKDLLDSQMLNYPINFISHVKFFDMLFGDKRIKNLTFDGLRNSIVIIDEVQNYKNGIWIEFINTLSFYAELLNIKIVIMSATLPYLNDLIKENDNSCKLIDNRDYYYDYFKNRVEYDYSLLDKGIDELYLTIDNVIRNTDKHRILIETLTTKSCEEIYQYLKQYESEGFLIYKMLGVTNKTTRQNIINKIQEKQDGEYKNKKMILVGTQCVEAGIDIDMEIGFKDISILDADEQFIGRINRNFKNRGLCYFFDIDDGNFIYKGDYRTERNLKHKEWQEIFETKAYNLFYKRNFEWLKKDLEDNKDQYNTYLKNLSNLQYKEIYNFMKLINTDTYNFLFMSEFNDNGDIISSKDLFKQYIELKRDFSLSYAEKEIKKRSIKNNLNTFTYSINTFKFKEDLSLSSEEGLYIIEDGYRYFDNLDENNRLTGMSNIDLEGLVRDLDLFL